MEQSHQSAFLLCDVIAGKVPFTDKPPIVWECSDTFMDTLHKVSLKEAWKSDEGQNEGLT